MSNSGEPENSLESTFHAGSHEEAQWISLSDLMTGLMMMFMLIAIAFMMKVEADAAKVKQVAVLYDQVRHELYDELYKEFQKDLISWGAEITPDLAVRFQEPEVLFDTGEDKLKPRFQQILQDFFPRYIKIVTADRYKEKIQEIRIEGHTSSFWTGAANPEEAYFNNMELSQSRTRSTLRFVLGLPRVHAEIDWLRKHTTANGLSSSHLILDGITENTRRSQRVEFRIRTDADSGMASILETMQ